MNRTLLTSATVGLAMVLGVFATPSAHAQGNLNAMQKAQYLQGVVGAMQEKIKKGDQARVRMMVIGSAALARPFFGSRNDPRFGPIINGWLAAHEVGWPGQTQLAPDELAKLMKTIETHKTRLGTMRKDFSTDSMPRGVKEFRRFVANAITQRESAWAYLDTIAMESPPPILLMQNQLLWQKLASTQPYFPVFYNALFGPSICIGIAQQKVVPEALQAAESSIADATSSKVPSTIWGNLDDATRNLDIVSTIEASLRSEGPPVAMPQAAEKVTALREVVKKEMARATEIKDREIDANRMPKNAWKGGGGSALLAKLRAAYSRYFSKEKVLRMVVTSSETFERWETSWTGGVALTVYASYVNAATAAKQENGNHSVYIGRYVRTRKVNGGWTGWRYQSPISSYRIRPKNIKK